MEKVEDCKYCANDERVSSIMIKVRDLNVSTLHLFKEQTYRGRCILVFRGHKTELFQLGPEERTGFMNDLAEAAGAISRAFSPDKINYALFGDTVPHMHVHLVPKYAGKDQWGTVFTMQPEPGSYLSEAEYTTMISDLNRELAAYGQTAKNPAGNNRQQ